MKKIILPFCIVLFTAFAAMSQDVSKLKNYTKLSSLLKGAIANAKTMLSEFGYEYEDAQSNELGWMMHHFENTDLPTMHPMFDEIYDLITVGTIKDKVAIIYFSFAPAEEESTIEVVKRITAFEEALKKAGCVQKSVEEEIFMTTKIYHDNSKKLKIKVSTFNVASIVNGADVYIYDWDVDESLF